MPGPLDHLVDTMAAVVTGEEDLVDRLRRFLARNALIRRVAVERARAQESP